MHKVFKSLENGVSGRS